VRSDGIIGLMTSEQYAAHLASLKPGTFWVDDLPDPLHTAADVADLFERVAVLKAVRLGVEKANRN
jgi:hypothetical protein